MPSIPAEGDPGKGSRATDDGIAEVIVHFDGGIRGDQMAFGFVAYDPRDPKSILFAGNGDCGAGTSNVAEYRALIAGLAACGRRGVKIVHIVGDSQLVINQITRRWRVNNAELVQHRDKALEILSGFEEWTAKWVRREQNKVADALVNEVFDRREQKCGGKSRQRQS